MKLIDKIFLVVETILILGAACLFNIPTPIGIVYTTCSGTLPYSYRSLSFSLFAIANLIAIWYLIYRKGEK